MLLQATVDGMSGMTFTLKDVIYILGLVLPIAGMLFKQNANNKASNREIESLKEDSLNSKNGRRAIKKELTIFIEKDSDVLHKRIDKTQEDFKEYRGKTDEEFKSINEKLATINSGIGEIKGILSK
jgi:predicted  nucleic acid-binding Zn-ribbon protein